MIKVRKDNDECVITKGVYDNLYYDLGYEIVDEEETDIKDAVISNENDDVETGEEISPVDTDVEDKNAEDTTNEQEVVEDKKDDVKQEDKSTKSKK